MNNHPETYIAAVGADSEKDSGRVWRAAVFLGILLLAASLALTGPLWSAPGDDPIMVADNGKGHDKGKGKNKWKYDKKRHYDDGYKHGGYNRGAVIIGGIPVIGYSEARRIALQHGCVGYAPLPVGVSRGLIVGKPLPPGIAKKMLPQPMLVGLPVYPGHEWLAVGNDLVLLAVGTSIIVDVLRNVFD